MTVSILQLSDVHFGGEDPEAAETALAHAWSARPDLTAVTGDLTLGGRRREFQAAAAWLERLPGPVIITPGNHDTPYYNLALRALRPFHRYRTFIGPEDGVAVSGEALAAAALNTARGAQARADWSKGVVDLEACARAAARLAEAPAPALKVLVCHHPLLDGLDGSVTGSVRRGREAAALLASAGVDLVISGHVHDPFARPLPFGDGRTVAVGAGTLSRRVRAAPAGFNWIEADETTLRVSALRASKGAAEVEASWTFERRVLRSGGDGAVPSVPDGAERP